MDISPVARGPGSGPEITLEIINDNKDEGQNDMVTKKTKAKKRLDYSAINEKSWLPKAINEEPKNFQFADGNFSFGPEKTHSVSYAYSFESLLKQEGSGLGFLNRAKIVDPIGSSDPPKIFSGSNATGSDAFTNGPEMSLVIQSEEQNADLG